MLPDLLLTISSGSPGRRGRRAERCKTAALPRGVGQGGGAPTARQARPGVTPRQRRPRAGQGGTAAGVGQVGRSSVPDPTAHCLTACVGGIPKRAGPKLVPKPALPQELSVPFSPARSPRVRLNSSFSAAPHLTHWQTLHAGLPSDVLRKQLPHTIGLLASLAHLPSCRLHHR